MSKAVMSSACARLAFACFLVTANHYAAAQPLGANPSAAPSDIRNPSSINPSAAASDIRNPSAINPSAARSQISQPTVNTPGQTKAPSPTTIGTIAPARRQARSPERSRSRRAAEMDNVTRPFEALEASRRERIELEKRLAQDQAKQLRLEREQKAKQAASAKSDAARQSRKR